MVIRQYKCKNWPKGYFSFGEDLQNVNWTDGGV